MGEMLRITDNGLAGSLPSEMFILSNQFGGSFPHQIWEYTDMVYLDAAYNKFEGMIPDDIHTRMPNLEVLFLENNAMSGTIPTTLGALNMLQRMHLDDNKFGGTIPTELGTPARMSELLLHDNLLTGDVPASIGDLNRLKLLTLHYNSLNQQTIDDKICELMYTKQLELATVDVNLSCECCQDLESSFV